MIRGRLAALCIKAEQVLTVWSWEEIKRWCRSRRWRWNFLLWALCHWCNKLWRGVFPLWETAFKITIIWHNTAEYNAPTVLDTSAVTGTEDAPQEEGETHASHRFRRPSGTIWPAVQREWERKKALHYWSLKAFPMVGGRWRKWSRWWVTEENENKQTEAAK